MEIQLSKVKFLFTWSECLLWYAFTNYINTLACFLSIKQLFFHLSPRWGFSTMCTHRPRWLQGQQWISQSPGRCLLCKTWRFETDWLPHRWTSSSTCILARKCPEKPILTWWGRQHTHIKPVKCLAYCNFLYAFGLSWQLRHCTCVLSQARLPRSAVCAFPWCLFALILIR